MNKLNLMCGIPGSGKSTFVKLNKKNNDIYISRDEVRFALVKEDEEYFSQEDKVFDTFVTNIVEALKEDKVVWADATHISPKSRAKLLRAIQREVEIDELAFFTMKTSLHTALERNEQRKNTRSFVPRGAIRRMFEQFQAPSAAEFKNTDFVYFFEVEENGKVKEQ